MRWMLAPLRLLMACMDRQVVWRLAAGSALAAAGGLLAGLAPLALGRAVDAAQHAVGLAPSPAVLWYAAAYLVCLLMSRGIAELRPILTSDAEQRVYAGLRLRFFRHVLHLPLALHLRQRSGAIVHAQQQALTGCQIALLSASSEILPVIVEFATVAAVLLSLDQPSLTLIFVATASAYLAVTLARAEPIRFAAGSVAQAGAAASAVFTDSLTNVEPLKSFGAERQTLTRYSEALHALRARWRQLQRQRLRAGLATTSIFVIAMTASLALAVRGLQNGSLSVGGFVLASVYLAQIVRPLEMLAIAVCELSQGLAFMRPLLDLLAEPTEENELKARRSKRDAHRTDEFGGAAIPAASALDRPSPPRTAQEDATATPPAFETSPRILFRDVRLSFVEGRAILDGLCLEVPAGRALAIVGASGCGKSSLVRLLLRLTVAQAGDILLDDAPIDSLSTDTLRAMVAVVPQDTVLFNATIAANIAVSKEGSTREEIEKAAELAGLGGFIASLPLGFDTPIGERGLMISGGERQRIAIARAALREPLIYVFDEATSMLDAATETAIAKNLARISSGRTSITIAHRLSSVRHVDEIVVLAGGRVVERGSHAALIGLGGLYASMWRAQGGGLAAPPCSPAGG